MQEDFFFLQNTYKIYFSHIFGTCINWKYDAMRIKDIHMGKNINGFINNMILGFVGV